MTDVLYAGDVEIF